jgi:hypothetical protein
VQWHADLLDSVVKLIDCSDEISADSISVYVVVVAVGVQVR